MFFFLQLILYPRLVGVVVREECITLHLFLINKTVFMYYIINTLISSVCNILTLFKPG